MRVSSSRLSIWALSFTLAIHASLSWPVEVGAAVNEPGGKESATGTPTNLSSRRPIRVPQRKTSFEWIPDIRDRLRFLDERAREAAVTGQAAELPGQSYRRSIPTRPTRVGPPSKDRHR